MAAFTMTNRVTETKIYELLTAFREILHNTENHAHILKYTFSAQCGWCTGQLKSSLELFQRAKQQ